MTSAEISAASVDATSSRKEKMVEPLGRQEGEEETSEEASKEADTTALCNAIQSSDDTKKKKTKTKEFAVGDHVFRWCSYRGIPFAYQQHAIVVQVNNRHDDDASSSIVLLNFDYEEEPSTEQDDGDINKADATASFWKKLQESASSTLLKEHGPQKDKNDHTSSRDSGDSRSGSDEPTTNKLEETDATENNDFCCRDILTQDIHTEQPSSMTKQPSQNENPFTKGLANFFQRRNATLRSNSEPSNNLGMAGSTDSKDCDDNQQQPSLQRSESSFSSLFAAASEDRPCTMTRQVLSLREAQEKWEHVQYGQPWHQRLVARAGTCSPLKPLPIPEVRMRLAFLQQNSELLQEVPYHHQKANGECIAAWCKAGRYVSAQGTAKLGQPGLHVASFGMAAEYGAMMGGQVAIGLLFPPAIPLLAAYDIYDVVHYGHTFHACHHANLEWERRTEKWNSAFSKYLQQHNNIIAQQDRLDPVTATLAMPEMTRQTPC